MDALALLAIMAMSLVLALALTGASLACIFRLMSYSATGYRARKQLQKATFVPMLVRDTAA